MSYTSNGLYLSNGHWAKMAYKDSLTPNVSISIDVVNFTTSEVADIFFEIIDTIDPSLNGVQYTHSKKVETIRFDVSSNQMKVYLNDVLTQTSNHSYSQFYWKWWIGGNRNTTIANLKIKPL